MLKKTVIILFLSIFVFKGYSETILKDQYASRPNQFFTQGLIVIDEKSTPFELYIEKNRDGFNNTSINIDENLYMSVSKEYDDLFQYNSKKAEGSDKFLDTFLPLELMNYPLRNREYTVLQKSKFFKYKNLNSNKIIITDKIIIVPEIIPEPEVIEISETISESEISEIPESETIETISEAEVSEILEPKESNTPEILETPELIEENLFTPNKYEKIILIVANGSNIILRKEFYLNKNDRNPKYIIETNSIKYIKGYYIATDWTIIDYSSKNIIDFKYNIKTIKYKKEDILKSFSKMTSFYGVK